MIFIDLAASSRDWPREKSDRRSRQTATMASAPAESTAWPRYGTSERYGGLPRATACFSTGEHEQWRPSSSWRGLWATAPQMGGAPGRASATTYDEQSNPRQAVCTDGDVRREPKKKAFSLQRQKTRISVRLEIGSYWMDGSISISLDAWIEHMRNCQPHLYFFFWPSPCNLSQVWLTTFVNCAHF